MLQICGIYGRTEDSLSLLKKGLYACELIYIYIYLATLLYIYIVYTTYPTTYLQTYSFARFVMFYGPWGRGSLGLGFEHQICLQDLSCFTAFGAAMV